MALIFGLITLRAGDGSRRQRAVL